MLVPYRVAAVYSRGKQGGTTDKLLSALAQEDFCARAVFYSLQSTRGEMNDETHSFERAMAICFVNLAKQQTNLQNKE
jgi:hypothetical protein